MFEWSTMILQKKKNNNNKINLIHNFKKNANIFKWIKKNMWNIWMNQDHVNESDHDNIMRMNYYSYKILSLI